VTHTIHVHYGGDLYEIRYSGTLITDIQKWFAGGHSVRTVAFLNLPEEVKNQIIKQMRKVK